MTEYIPCLLKRTVDTNSWTYKVLGSGDGWCSLEPIQTYTEELIPLGLDDLVQVVEDNKPLLRGPFKLLSLPKWAERWFRKDS